MRLRPATAADLPEIQRIVRDAYTPFIARIGRPPGPMSDDYAARIAKGCVTLAEDCGAVTGLIVLLDRADHLLLDNVAVDPPRQGQGVGRALLAYAETEALRRGLPEIRLYTNVKMTENIATYFRVGYLETGRGDADGYDRVFFAKALT